ncbi:hypothetical protein N7492_009473 [Penicillium capsulatum]|uniref:Uncharacterized protein n=1 Tax=Penicillium capsulatum TaxID=69766 RepID=A0A9W9LIA8_9EURO|nr:hypothetical protein N7492_009473 [Penicillium capsulatum]KAJ6106863.1 hypothetical protein N7512_010380 [Penicillium capsulatum]
MFSVGMTELHLLGFPTTSSSVLPSQDNKFWLSLLETGKYLTQAKTHTALTLEFQRPSRQTKMSNEWVEVLKKLLCGPDERVDIDEHLTDLRGVVGA